MWTLLIVLIAWAVGVAFTLLLFRINPREDNDGV